MGVFSACGEFLGSAAIAFIRKSAELKKEEGIIEPKSDCPEVTKQFIAQSLKSCRPASQDLTGWGRRVTQFRLGKNDYFDSLLAIDHNLQSTKRFSCVEALKTAAKCICAGYD